MKEQKKLRQTAICLLAAGTMLFTTMAMAQTSADKTKADASTTMSKEIKNKTREAASEKRATVIKEAVTALAQTKKAIEALDKKDKQKALDALAVVSGKLDIVIAREPDMANAPIDVRVETYDLISSVDIIKNAVKTAKDLLDDGEVQQAREILMGLTSEIDLIVTSLPLASYSQGIKAVAKLIDEEKYQESRESLYELLSTLVITRNVIPLPILRAEEMIKQAETLAAQENRTEEKNKELADLLAGSKTQLEMAEALGYGDKKDYKTFYKQLKEIEKKTEGGKFGTGYTEKLKKALKSFKEKIFGMKK